MIGVEMKRYFILCIMIIGNYYIPYASSCDIVGVYKILYTTSITHVNTIQNKTTSNNQVRDERYFIITNDEQSSLATLYNIKIVEDNVPYYTREAKTQERKKIKSFSIVNQCKHLLKDAILHKTAGRHEQCPVDFYFYGNNAAPIRDTSNPLMKLDLNDITYEKTGGRGYTYTTNHSFKVIKTEWSDNYINNIKQLISTIQNSELPVLNPWIESGSSRSNLQPTLPHNYEMNDKDIWDFFTSQYIPVTAALRIKPVSNENQQKVADIYSRESQSAYYHESFKNLYNWNVDNYCQMLSDAINGIQSGLIIDLYSKQRGTFTQNEFVILKQLMSSEKAKYNYSDTLITKYKSIVVSGRQTDTLIKEYNDQITAIIGISSKLAEFKKDIFSKYISTPLLLTPKDNSILPSTVTPLFISVRNAVRSESKSSTYASMIDSNIFIKYDKLNTYKTISSNQQNIDSLNLKQYTDSKRIPTDNLLASIRKTHAQNPIQLDSVQNVTEKSEDQILSYMKYYVKDLKYKSSGILERTDISIHLIQYINSFIQLVDKLQTRMSSPNYVRYINYSIKNPFNSYFANNLHNEIWKYFVVGSYNSKNLELTIENVINNIQGYYSADSSRTWRDWTIDYYKPYQDNFPKLLAYNKEFDKNNVPWVQIQPFLGRLANLYRLDSNRFKYDINYYFDSCFEKGPTIDFFEEKNYTAFYWGVDHQRLVDTLMKSIADIEYEANRTISDLKKKIDILKRAASGIDNKIQVNMLDYAPYRDYMKYGDVKKPELILEQLSKNNVELTTNRIDSVYELCKKDELRIKDIRQKSLYTVFRNGTSINTLPYLESHDIVYTLIRKYIVDSIFILKNNLTNSSYLDDIYEVYVPKAQSKKLIRDSLYNLYVELFEKVRNLDYSPSLTYIISAIRPKLLSNDDSLFKNLSELKKRYYSVMDNYAKHYLPIDTVAKNIKTNIPNIDIGTLCDVVKEYEQTKGHSAIWSTVSPTLIIEVMKYHLRLNRNLQNQGNYHSSNALRYDIEEHQWIVDKPSSDREFWYFNPSCTERSILGFTVENQIFSMRSMYFNVDLKY